MQLSQQLEAIRLALAMALFVAGGQIESLAKADKYQGRRDNIENRITIALPV